MVWSATSLVFTTTTISWTMVWILKLSELGDESWCQRRGLRSLRFGGRDIKTGEMDLVMAVFQVEADELL